MAENTYQADVIVVGGGLAGVVTALELLEHGRSVVLIDRDKEEHFGGLSNWAFGGMFFVDSQHQRRAGIRDSVDLALRDWYSFAEFSEEDHWPKRWAEQFVHLCTDEGYRWLRGKGIKWFPAIHWVERGLFRPGNSVPRFHLTWGTGRELVQVLIGHLRNHARRDRLQLVFGHRVETLTTTDNQVDGVRGVLEESGEPFTARAEQVVVAAGGIGGSIERVKENWPADWGRPPEMILNGTDPFGDGTLHDAAEKVNGHITHLDWMWNYAAGVHHPQPRHPEHGLSLVPPKSALWVNFRGERFGPVPLITAYDTRYLVERICREEKKYSWQILNLRIAYKEFAISGSEHNAALRDKKLAPFLRSVLFGNRKLVHEMIDSCEDFVVADSIGELAEKMNALTGTGDVEIGALRDSIGHYDAQIDRGRKFFNDEQLRRIAHTRQYVGDRLRTCKFQKIYDTRALPLIAIREFILARKSLGGIQTDLQCRVLSRPENGQQATIPGLYAVGEAAGFGGGGMHGKRALEGTFLSSCVLTGRLAARSIARGEGMD